MSTVPASNRGGALATWREAANDWAAESGVGWLHVFRAFSAAMLTLWLAMRLELPQPRIALITAFIITQPHSGTALAKSFYRVCSTVVGALVSVALVALFPQQPTLFLLGLIGWLALCTMGTTRNRNFRSYAFALAGYTAFVVGIPTLDNSTDIFMSATARLSEVALGIIVSTVVSAVVFPQQVSSNLKRVVRGRFTKFADFISAALSGNTSHADIEAANLHFIADVVNLEAARSIAVFENPEIRLRNGRLNQFNSNFMVVSTRLHALQQTLGRLRARRHAKTRLVLDAFDSYWQEIPPCLSPADAPVLQPADAGASVVRLEAFRSTLSARLAHTRVSLEAQAITADDLLDFDTVAELLWRFIDELHTYTASYASLAATLSPIGIESRPYTPKIGWLASAVSGLRTVLIMAVVCLFYYYTNFPSGKTLILYAGITCSLCMIDANPARMAYQFMWGGALSLPAGIIIQYILLPQVDGFPMLVLILAPFLIGALCLTTKPRWSYVGVGSLTFFGLCTAVPGNPTVYDPMGFFNDTIAFVIAAALTFAIFELILPPTSGWWLKHIVKNLRRQVVATCIGRRDEIAHDFENTTRDLIYQAGALVKDRPDAQHIALTWMFVTLEIGHAMLELRSTTEALIEEAEFARQDGWSKPLSDLRHDMARLFEKPTLATRRSALASTMAALAHVQQSATALTLSQAPTKPETTKATTDISALRQYQRLLHLISYLHFMRSALLDPHSPLPGSTDFHATSTGAQNAA